MKEALRCLSKSVTKRVIVHYGIGMSCGNKLTSYEHNLWTSKYLPLLGHIAAALSKQAIWFLMVKPEIFEIASDHHQPSHGIFPYKLSTKVLPLILIVDEEIIEIEDEEDMT
ncbi:hypothetical protein TCON_2813 [Astathelohania contejeani]|uniref:Uncharacterized protein n=1 Tax=Astathelohania contejeani TaxID=164912 RepID=A0ABQ7HUY6_9MICR|nr:hypothetical protein TCON_2813 [Thelohania contejeani]